ncbi:hypothetical protein EPIR_1668 [Erwinia piriflorinigrans CFBP 5888]|uniref:Uncharacterized protein n=1 Tax=Erwinia piriflorinigrans CFBP 5888 TaxID=1161919 RepID=V5Z717_9GAMM|nr:hypothetical protein EPIR_1668 [Erwinia piriflorinigrans CFBP 5888]
MVRGVMVIMFPKTIYYARSELFATWRCPISLMMTNRSGEVISP